MHVKNFLEKNNNNVCRKNHVNDRHGSGLTQFADFVFFMLCPAKV